MLTVIFSSYNGADSLPMMLEILTKVIAPSGGWKLIAVDNASTDNTRAILDSYLEKLPLTVLNEKKQGKNAALNTGLEYIEGDLVVFTDDDIVADSNWLVNLRTQVDKQKSYDIFAGRITPYWSIEPTDWVLQWVNHQVVYGITPTDLKMGEISAGCVWGANMAIRSQIFESGFRFDVSVGPDGTENYKMGSETSFTGLLEKQGYKSFYVPEATVQHIISMREMDYSWVLGRATRFGRGLFYAHFKQHKESPVLLAGIPRYLIRLYIENWFCLMRVFLSRNKKNIFLARWNVNETKGIMLEARAHFEINS